MEDEIRKPMGTKEDLHAQERIIQRGQANWIDRGRALQQVKGRDLYCFRVPSWHEYLAGWGIKWRQAEYMIFAASKVAPNIADVRHALSLNAALKLSRLPDGQQAACLLEAIKMAGSLGPSAKVVAEAVAKRLPPKAKKRKRGKLKIEPVKLKLPSFGNLTLVLRCTRELDLRVLLKEIEEALTARLASPPRSDAA